MKLKNKGVMYLGISFFLWLIYSIIELVLSRKIIENDLLLTFLMGFRYIILFFVILFFFFSVYKLSFAYPEKRNKIPLILSLIGIPLFLIIGIFINPPQGDMAGLGWVTYFAFIIPLSALVFLGLSFFTSRIAFKIDTLRKKDKKTSIFLWPIIISSILFILFSAYTYFSKDYGFQNSLLKIIIDAITGFSNSLPFVFVYIPIIVIIFFIWVYYIVKR